MHYVTVFGATGKIGGELLKLLSQAGVPTIAVSPRSRGAVALGGSVAPAGLLPGVTWMEADITDPASLPLPFVKAAASSCFPEIRPSTACRRA
ncbi:MAG TPA: hypothetical protein VGS79_05940 [Puia sp.]|nr:hypothetical protein [Puia sp.]